MTVKILFKFNKKMSLCLNYSNDPKRGKQKEEITSNFIVKNIF